MPRLVALALLLCSCSFEPMTERPEPGDTQPDAPPQIACNHDLYETELAGHRYYLTDPMTWTAARDHCTATGGYLLTLETREEDQAAYDRLWQRNGYVWIGLQDVTTTDDYRWIKTNEPPGYTNWRGNTKPTDPEKNCVDLKASWNEHAWYAWSCDAAEAAVCECDD